MDLLDSKIVEPSPLIEDNVREFLKDRLRSYHDKVVTIQSYAVICVFLAITSVVCYFLYQWKKYSDDDLQRNYKLYMDRSRYMLNQLRYYKDHPLLVHSVQN